MKTEIEAKFLDVDTAALRTILVQERATCVHAERLMRRKNFDAVDGRLGKIGGWVRVRDEGDKITLAYKQLNDRTLHGTKEISLDVSSFDTMCDFLLATGFAMKSYQETRRERWELDGVEITIDTWPWIKPFVEIEGESEDALRKVAKTLGFDWKDALHGSVENAYMTEYDVTEEEIDSWETITFTPMPEWLEIKRK